MKRKKSVSGYIQRNLLEPLSIKIRHNELVAEMNRRGYNHKTDMTDIDLPNLISYLPIHEQNHKIDRESAKNDLFTRCKLCGKIH